MDESVQKGTRGGLGENKTSWNFHISFWIVTELGWSLCLVNVIGLCVFDQSLFVKLLLNAQFFLRVKHSRFPHTLTFPLCLICDSNQEQLTFKHEERKKASRKPRRHPYTHTGEWGRERFHTELLERGGEWGRERVHTVLLERGGERGKESTRFVIVYLQYEETALWTVTQHTCFMQSRPHAKYAT